MASKSSKARAAFEAANLEAARIIAADPAKYPPDSLLGQWAAMVLDRKTVVDTPAPGPLFKPEAAA